MATIQDIADLTGFSIMTVSRALNEPQKVKESTREKIIQAVDKLGYVQNRMARSLAQSKAYNICIYVPSTLNATELFVAQTISAIGERLGCLGYSLSLRRQMVIDANCDGMIAMGLKIDEEEEFCRIAAQKPAVLYGNSDKFVNWVDVDNYYGIYSITDYIINTGRAKIAYIGLKDKAHYVEQRRKGFTDAMGKHKLRLDSAAVISADNDEVSGFDACETLLSQYKPEAIVCATDLVAVGCMHALQRRKIAIPADIAVSGFDGFGMEKTVFPKLTTVKQPLYAVGVKLVDTMVDMLNGVPHSEGIFIKPVIEKGGSV